jgi:hypothetical protein
VLLAALAVVSARHHGHPHLHHGLLPPRHLDVALPARVVSTADGPPAVKPAVVVASVDAKPAPATAPADAAAAVTAKLQEMSAHIQQLEGVISDLRSHPPPPPPPFLVHLLRGAGRHGPPPPHFENGNEWDWHRFHGRGGPRHHHGPHPVAAFIIFFGIVYCTYRFARFVVRQCCCADVGGNNDDAGTVQYPAYARVGNPYAAGSAAEAVQPNQVLPMPVPASAPTATVISPADAPWNVSSDGLQHGIVLGTPVSLAQQ